MKKQKIFLRNTISNVLLFFSIILNLQCTQEEQQSANVEKNKDSRIEVENISKETLGLLQGHWVMINSGNETEVIEIEFRKDKLFWKSINKNKITTDESDVVIAKDFVLDKERKHTEKKEFFLIYFSKEKYYAYDYIISLDKEGLSLMSGLSGQVVSYKRKKR